MNKEFSFIIIDDSELDCFISQKFLERTNNKLIIKTFQHAEHALETIRKSDGDQGNILTIILLDLLMPGMSGFRFIEEFEKLPAEIQKNYRIIILTVLSSNSNSHDAFRMLTYGSVNSIIEKPLTAEKLISLIDYVRSGKLQ